MLPRRNQKPGIQHPVELLERRVLFAVQAAGAVTGLTLYNAVDDVPYGPLESYPTVSHVGLNTWGFTVKAETAGPLGSIRWAFDGNGNHSTENYAPYSVAGDINGSDMQPFPLTPGTHTIKATAYSGKGATGTVLNSITRTFTVVDTPHGPAAVNGPLTALVLYNAGNDVPYGPLENYPTVSHAGLNTAAFTVKAETAAPVGSIRWGYDGNEDFSTENYAPYSIAGDINGSDMRPFPMSPGTHTVKAVAYAGKNGTGTMLGSITRTFTVADTPSGPAGGGGPVVSFSDTSADAKEAGLDKGTFVISRTGSTAAPLDVGYNVSGSASNALDYQQLSGTITIPAGRSSVNLVITPKDDSLVEGTENVVLTINPGNGYTVGSTATATCPILDNDSSTSPGLGTLTFRQVAPNPLSRAEAIGTAVNGKLYVMGGFNGEVAPGAYDAIRRVDVYDPAANSWRRLRDMPFTEITHAGTAVDGKYIWFVGNYRGDHPGPGNRAVYRYDTSNDTWATMPSLPVDRGAGAAAIIGRTLHFVGGLGADRGADKTDHFVLNLDNISTGWTRKASLPVGRNHLSAAAVGGKLYAIGGQTDEEENQSPKSSVYAYNPAIDRWTQVASLPAARSHTTQATFGHNGRIIVIGGQNGFGVTQTSVLAYDPATNKWSQIGSLPFGRSTMVAGIVNGKIYASTGNGPSETSQTLVGTFG